MSALHLTTGRVNLGLLRDDARSELTEYFCNLDGSKAIIWDPELMGPFNVIGDNSFLRQNGVNQMFQIQSGCIQATMADHIIYVIRPTHSVIKKITENIRNEESVILNKEAKRKFHILFIPRGSLICERKLADLGILGDISSVIELPVLYPLDNDLVSLELPSSFYECYVEQDFSSLFNVSAAIMKMQVLYGFVPNVCGLGKSARQVADLIHRMRLELGGPSPKIRQRFDSILLLDRSVDLITPLVTQRTYEGLIDELFGINHNSVKLPSDKFFSMNESPTEQVQPNPGGMKSFSLSSAEELFSELRDKNFKEIGPYLSQKSKMLTNVKMETNQAKSVHELKQIVDKLPRFQVMKKSLSDHLAIGEMIKQITETESFLEKVDTESDFLNFIDTDQKHPVIEDMISKSEDLITVLRLICLQSQTNSGMKRQVVEFYKREIIQTYGFQHVISLHNLEKVGLLKTSSSSSLLQTSNLKAYNVIRKTLRLTSDRTKREQTDIHHVYNGYAPITVRLAEFLIHPGWRAITEIFKYLPEPCFEEDQNINPTVGRRSSTVYSDTQESKTVLIVYLGGITFAEISALRFLAKKKPRKYTLANYSIPYFPFLVNVNYVILTTKVINGGTFIKSLSEPLNG